MSPSISIIASSKSPDMALAAKIRGATLLRAFGALGSAEAVNRITRVIAAICLARALDPVAFGIAAISLTTAELLRVFTQTGLGAQIAQAKDDELEEVCAAAHRLNWIMHGGMFMIQLLLAQPLAVFFESPEIAWLTALLAVPLLIYPMAAVRVFRVQRQNRMGVAGAMNAVQVSTDNLLMAAMALAGFGLWSVVIPKLIAAPIWVLCYARLEPWRPAVKAKPEIMRQCLAFGGKVLGSEVIGALSVHADKFIIGALLGLKAVGIYFFAFNAGLGITRAFVAATSLGLLPYLCAARDPAEQLARFHGGVGMSYAMMAPILIAQVGLAPFYVPIVFGEQWAGQTSLVMLLCLTAVTWPLWRATVQFWRAQGRPGQELRWTILYTVLSLAATALGTIWGLMAIGYLLLAVNLLVVPLAAYAALGGRFDFTLPRSAL
jgi:teichuronic acid exporter